MSAPTEEEIGPTIVGTKYVDLRNSLNYTLEKSFRSFSVAEFFKCFSGTTKTERAVLRKYYTKIIKVLREKLKDECETIFQERDIQAHLNKLEAIVAWQPVLNSGDRCPLPPDVSPTDICRAKVFANRLAERDALRAESHDDAKEIADLSKEIACLQESQEALQTEISTALDTTALAHVRDQLAKSVQAI